MCSQKFRGYETHITFFPPPQTLNKISCMKVPNKMDNVQRKEEEFYDSDTDFLRTIFHFKISLTHYGQNSGL